jgi:hypothetical protein
MTPTPTLATRAARAVIYANAARASHKLSAPKRRHAIRQVALALIYELRKSGKSIPRSTERALRHEQ